MSRAERGGKTKDGSRKSAKYQTEQTTRLREYELTNSQKAFQNVIRDNRLIFVEGPAGVGKSFTILHHFCEEYLRDRSKKIIVIKTPVESAGRDKVGFLPSDLSAKIEPHFASTKKLLSDLLGAGKVDCDIGNRIEFKIPNFILGATLDDSLIFIDEAQMLEPLILKLLLERIGQNSVCVVAGDSTQIYAVDVQRNALRDAIPRFFEMETHGDKSVVRQSKYPQVGYFKFYVEDVMRDDIVKTVIRAYSNNS